MDVVDDAMEAIPLINGEDLVQLVHDGVAKDSWDEEGHSINFQNGLLFVKTTDEIHAKIEAFLSQVRKDYFLQVRLEFTAVAHTPAFQAELLGRSPHSLTDAQVEDILKAAASDGAASLVGRLEMRALQHQRVSAHSGTQRAYVASYADGKPQRSLAFDGLGLDVRPTLSNDRKTVSVRIMGTILKTLGFEKVKTADGEVEIPKQSRVPIRLSPTVECGSHIVLLQAGPVEGFGQGRTQVLVILRATPITAK
jgi:hypothetical protein